MSAVLRSLALVAALALLSACQEDGPRASTSEEAARPDLLEEERIACLRDGGRFGPAAGKGAFVCYRDLPDAYQTCSSADDCSGLCLARSRTCSPVEPFYGCHEVLLKGGQPATQCIN